jgi:hypothetical protein
MVFECIALNLSHGTNTFSGMLSFMNQGRAEGCYVFDRGLFTISLRERSECAFFAVHFVLVYDSI